MDIDIYQEEATKTQKDSAKGVDYLVVGLCSEAGEVADKFKKAIRDNQGVLDPVETIKELGDCLWYIALLSKTLGFDLSEVANLNLDKLQSRQERDKISGSGDNR